MPPSGPETSSRIGAERAHAEMQPDDAVTTTTAAESKTPRHLRVDVTRSPAAERIARDRLQRSGFGGAQLPGSSAVPESAGVDWSGTERGSEESVANRRFDAGRRPLWRQQLVTAERGLVSGMRRDSALFGHFFGVCLIVAAAAVLNLRWGSWLAVISALGTVLTAEMLRGAISTLAAAMQSATDDRSPQAIARTAAARSAAAMATGAVVVAMTGATIVIVIAFVQRLDELF